MLAILDRIRRQDTGEIEPPAIALSGKMGANPASEDFLEQSAAASRQQAGVAVAAAADDEEEAESDEVGSLLACDYLLSPFSSHAH